jgi:CheY-like chemotaxis protein
VYCDEEKARRVIVNLAVNAIKFTPEGGSVEFWAHADEQGQEVTIGVTVTGPGLSAENLSIIFERFRQVDQGLRASTKGFGLGLNIAKELVALNLGRINVESDVVKGSTFSFTLPNYEPCVLLQRYLFRIQSLVGPDAQVSLISATIDCSQYSKAAPVVDEFLQRSVRANDLVASFIPGKWLIAAVCPGCAGELLIDRLTSEWSKFTRNAPNMELPKIQFQQYQTYEAGRESAALANEYLNLSDRLPAQPAVSSAANSTVLVVDDDPEVSQCLGVRLQAAGFQVLMAADGMEGLSAARAHHPDAVVLDVRMPKKDGMEVLRELRGDPAMMHKPIVMLSASVRDQHRALEAGASYFVLKPYESTEVLSALESSLHRETLA